MTRANSLGRNFNSPPQKNAGFAFFVLLLYTVSVLVRPHEFSIETSDLIIIRIFLIVCFVFTLLNLRPIPISPQLYLLLALVPTVLLSGIFNGWLGGGVQSAQEVLVNSIIPFFLYMTLLTNIKRQKILMTVSLFAAMCMVFNGHIQQQSYSIELGLGIGIGNSYTVGNEEMRISYLGFFGDPNDLGMFLVMNLPFVVYFYHTGKILTKLVMVSAVIMLCYGIYMTGSRGTILGSIGVISIFYLVKNAGAKLILFSALMAPVAATLIASFGGLSSQEASAQGRLYAWYDGVLMLMANPVWGVGLDNFMDLHGRVAHNSYIQVAAELGVLGYSMWGGALILSILTGYQVIKKFPTWDIQDTIKSEAYGAELLINKALFFSMIGFMLTGFFLSRQFTLLLFIFLGMLTASHWRLMVIRPELKSLYRPSFVFKCVGYSWIVIIAVYGTIKVGL